MDGTGEPVVLAQDSAVTSLAVLADGRLAGKRGKRSRSATPIVRFKKQAGLEHL